ncbi:MAG: hypothetical protein JNJ83_15855 [Verrucomicrobiaceae bacterium]|nr:hypothetical protein [Verrucomicrobiaceae bacterium]
MIKATMPLLIAVLTACAVPPAPPASTSALSPAQLDRVGRRIWQNECAGTVEGLTSWNQGEHFASLGIGHFIWYPAGASGPFEESFPPLIAYLQQTGAQVPNWLLQTPDCPWPDRASFIRDSQSERQRSLRQLLAGTVRQQTQFIIARLNRTIPRLASEGGAVAFQSYQVLSQTPEGLFAMIDYINFKGDGLNPAERYNGQGWGLAQVLGNMEKATPQEAPAAFANSAKVVLSSRVKNSPPSRNETKWLSGWHSRCAAYANPL